MIVNSKIKKIFEILKVLKNIQVAFVNDFLSGFNSLLKRIEDFPFEMLLKNFKKSIYNVTVLCYTKNERRVIMDDNLISKKELLEYEGISYGQLYRWKRKNLIPEEWFIKKSTFTGQETFFPREKILERISKIKNMKDDLSLDDLAEVFSPQLAEIMLNKEDLISKNIVSQMTIEIYENYHGKTEVFTFEKILFTSVVEKFLQTGSVSLDEGKGLLQNMEDNYKYLKDKNCEIVFIRKLGVAVSFLIAVPNEFYIDKTSKVVEKINLSKLIEEIKIKIGG